MPKVKEIQVCGGTIIKPAYHGTLADICLAYLQDVIQGTDREKIRFTVILDDDTVKDITFRQEDDGIQVYGDFEGIPNFLEWSKRETQE